MDLPAISAALCAQLGSIDNVRVYDGYQDAVFTGNGIAVVVRPGDPWVSYLEAMVGGMATVRYVIEIAVQRANLRSAQTRIALINTLLDWWVSDTDLDHVERIYMSANTSDRAAIRTAIEPRLTSLTSLGQRFRLMAVFTHH